MNSAQPAAEPFSVAFNAVDVKNNENYIDCVIRGRVILSCLLVHLFVGCSDSPESEVREAPIATADNTSDSVDESHPPVSASGLRDFDGLSLRVPEGWREVELSDFQRGVITARFELPGHGDRLTLTISSVGGGTDANFQRWRGQFSGAAGEEDSFDVRARRVRWIELSGRFTPGFSQDTEGNWAMIGVAIPHQAREVYLKLTGPTDQVREARDAMRTFVRSARTTL